MDTKKVIEKRHSTRSFKDKKARLKDILTICEAGTKAPKASNINTIRYIIVDDKDKLNQIASAAPYNEFVGEANWLIIVASDYKKIVWTFASKGRQYATQQAGAAIENMLLQATDLGLGSCWVSSFDENAVKRILNIPDDSKIEAIIPVGYEFKKPTKKARPSLKSVIYYNRFGKKTW